VNALVLDSLVVGRGAFRAGPFDLACAPGQVVALVGPNGGGKTTLLATLAGLIPPLAGRVERPGAVRPALLPAPGAIDVGFAAGHVVALGRAALSPWSPSLRRSDRAAAHRALHRLGIGDLAERPFDRLSSGQRQLVLLARLFVQEAPVCLLDEPTAMLDPAQAAKVEAAIAALARDGRIVVFATHALAAASLADLVVAVGDPISIGGPADVLTDERLSRLYGASLNVCPACGQSAAATTAA